MDKRNGSSIKLSGQLDLAGTYSGQLEKQINFDQNEKHGLLNRFKILVGYHLILLLASFFATQKLIATPGVDIYICLCAALLGSTIAAFTSTLNRRALGWEDSKGNREPQGSGERFNAGMLPWLSLRPWLGALVGGVFYWGIQGGVFNFIISSSETPGRLAFLGFVAGLLAKTLIEIFKDILRNFVKKS